MNYQTSIRTYAVYTWHHFQIWGRCKIFFVVWTQTLWGINKKEKAVISWNIQILQTWLGRLVSWPCSTGPFVWRHHSTSSLAIHLIVTYPVIVNYFYKVRLCYLIFLKDSMRVFHLWFFFFFNQRVSLPLSITPKVRDQCFKVTTSFRLSDCTVDTVLETLNSRGRSTQESCTLQSQICLL